MQFEERDINHTEECQKIVRDYNNKPQINYGGGRVYYSPVDDLIQLPKTSHFKTIKGYYSTLFHELVHSTGHISRLNRLCITNHNPFGTCEYSRVSC